MQRAGVVSTHPEADEVAAEILRDDGSAMAAALGGFFAAAGSEPGVLFAPLTILVGGGGAGGRVFDGRCRQPGLGAKRPRGWTDSEVIPEAAYAAVPGSVAAAVVACAYVPGTSVNAVVRRGVAAARRVGAAKRAALLGQVASLGAGVLGDPRLKGILLGELGPAQGGLIASGDLMPPRDLDRPALERDGLWVPPWLSDGDAPDVAGVPVTSTALGVGHVLCAVDVRGLFVVLSFRSCTVGIELEDLEVCLPKLAVPVRRGVPRVEPGASLPAPAPIAVRRGPSGQVLEALASPRAQRLDDAEIVLRRDPDTLDVSTFRG